MSEGLVIVIAFVVVEIGLLGLVLYLVIRDSEELKRTIRRP